MSVSESAFENKKENESLGEYLVQARKTKGYTVEEMAHEIRISLDFMKSIEASEWEKLPVEAYVRGYLNSISQILELDSKVVLNRFLVEKGSVGRNRDKNQDPIEGNPSNTDEHEKKSFFIPILIVVLGLAFFVLMNFVNQFENTESSEEQVMIVETLLDEQNQEESVESTTLIHDAAELVILDSLVRDSLPIDTLAVVADADTAKKKKDLPASATIFISSSSKDTITAKKMKTVIELMGSGVTTSWVGIKRYETDTVFLKEANIRTLGGRLIYESSDSLCVIIGNPDAVSKMLLNGKEVPLPQMKPGLVTRFRLFAGKII